MIAKAKLRLAAPDNWVEWNGTRYTVVAGSYDPDALIAALNAAQAEAVFSIVLVSGVYRPRVDPVANTAWTLAAGPGVLYFLGLETLTEGSNGAARTGNPVSGLLEVTVRRRWGMQPKWASQTNHRVCSTVIGSPIRAEDIIILMFEDDGLACRFFDQVAAGLLCLDSTDYFLLDDAVNPERTDGELVAELNCVVTP